MKLAEARRRITEGTVIDAVGHLRPDATGRRFVTRVQGNGFWYRLEGRPTAFWVSWPKAALTRSDGPDTITLLLDDGRPMSSFTVVA